MSQTGLKRAGGIYNEARLTTDLTIYRFLSAAEKTLFFFLPAKPLRNPLKKRSDHSFYHKQTRNTRKQWTKKARGASVLERKRHESTQSAREDRPTSVGVVQRGQVLGVSAFREQIGNQADEKEVAAMPHMPKYLKEEWAFFLYERGWK